MSADNAAPANASLSSRSPQLPGPGQSFRSAAHRFSLGLSRGDFVASSLFVSRQHVSARRRYAGRRALRSSPKGVAPLTLAPLSTGYGSAFHAASILRHQRRRDRFRVNLTKAAGYSRRLGVDRLRVHPSRGSRRGHWPAQEVQLSRRSDKNAPRRPRGVGCLGRALCRHPLKQRGGNPFSPTLHADAAATALVSPGSLGRA